MENLSRLRRWSPNLLKADPSVKAGVRTRRLKCGWDETYLLRILAAA